MVKPRQQVNLLASPPKDKALDMQMVRDMMKSSGKKVVCGGSSANMVARCLNRQVYTTLTYSDPSIPPTGIIDGIDLVTEGVLTMSRTVEILRDIIDEKADADDIKRMDEDNGAAQLAKMLLENCTHLKLFIGTAINPAHQNPNLPTDLSIKLKLIDQLCVEMEKLGKTVEKTYY